VLGQRVLEVAPLHPSEGFDVPRFEESEVDLLFLALCRALHRIDERARRLAPESLRIEARRYPLAAELFDRPFRFGGFGFFLSSVDREGALEESVERHSELGRLVARPSRSREPGRS
jgi:hypothetical protein